MNVKLFFFKVHHCGLLALTLALLSVSLAAKNYLASCYELIKAPYHIYVGYEDKKDEVTADNKAMPSVVCATGVIAWAVTPLPGWFQHLIASIMEGRVSTWKSGLVAQDVLEQAEWTLLALNLNSLLKDQTSCASSLVSIFILVLGLDLNGIIRHCCYVKLGMYFRTFVWFYYSVINYIKNSGHSCYWLQIQ